MTMRELLIAIARRRGREHSTIMRAIAAAHGEGLRAGEERSDEPDPHHPQRHHRALNAIAPEIALALVRTACPSLPLCTIHRPRP